MQTLTQQQELDRAILGLFPEQGRWGAEDYFWLTDRTNHLIEFTDGFVEVLPMPPEEHQEIVQFLFLILLAWARPRGGKVHFAPLRVRIRDNKFREPDLILLRDADDPRRGNRYWTGADLALEVVSEDTPARDLVEKVRDYAEGPIPEYWIVNPLDETITVLSLVGARYVEHGVFRRGDLASSVVLEGLTVEVGATFDAR